MKNMERLKKAVFVTLVSLVAAQLVASNVLAGKGRQLVELEEEASKLARDNARISAELAKERSLARIASEASALGFSKPGSITYLNLTEPVAAAPSDYDTVP